MSRASRITLLIFLASVVAVLGLLGFMTDRMFRLERAKSLADFEAGRQESLRLALWRMDSAVAPIIAQEAARPYFHYLPYYPEQRAFTRVWEPVKPGEVLVPSPLVEGTPPYVLLHFQIGADGRATSPQVPQGNDRDLAESEPGGPERVAHYERLLSSFTSLYFDDPEPRAEAQNRGFDHTRAAGTDQAEFHQLERPTAEREYGYRKEAAELSARPAPVTGQIAAQIAEGDSARNEVAPDASLAATLDETVDAPAPVAQTLSEMAFNGAEDETIHDSHNELGFKEKLLGAADTQSRTQEAVSGRAVERDTRGAETPGDVASRGSRRAPNILSLAPMRTRLPVPDSIFRRRNLQRFGTNAAGTPRQDLSQSAFVPRWRRGGAADTPELLVWRSVRAESSTTLQGFWIDWPALERHLLSRVEDVLPGASIMPVMIVEALDPSLSSRLLASIPAIVVPPPGSLPPIPLLTPSHVTLGLTWLATLVAVGAVGLSLRASISLGERRGRFVSAVTHELRTPLTTFVLYSQMLADGMVPDGEPRREYLATLKGEATRLQRIVENVLEFARLGRSSPASSATVGAETFSVGSLIDHVVPGLHQRATQSGMTLEVSVDPAARDTLTRTSRDAVARVLTNLVDNACKYASEAEDKTITLHAGVSRDRVLLRVRDRGPGIPASERRRIFRAFARGRKHEQSAMQGLGLGLSLARAIARQHDGDLRLDRAVRGASFTLQLPRAGA